MNKSEELELILQRLHDQDQVIQRQALDILFQFVKGSDSVGANATFNLEYLEKRKQDLESIWKEMSGDNQRFLSDMLSVIYVLTDDTLSLHYRINGNVIPLETWGHQYVKKILTCILKLNSLDEKSKQLTNECIEFLFKHNLEVDAIDFLDELNMQEQIIDYVDEHNYNRISLYLQDFTKYNDVYEIILLQAHKKMENYSAILVSILKHERESIPRYIKCIPDKIAQIQLVFMLARANYVLPQEDFSDEIISNVSLFSISANHLLQKFFKNLCEDLQIEKPRQIKDFLKGMVLIRGDSELSLKSIAPISLTNSFVHMGFGRDTIFMPYPEDIQMEIDFNYIGNTARTEVISMYASFGTLHIFDQRKAFESLNEHIFSDNKYRKTGALLGLGISNSKIFDPNHTALALLLENLNTDCQYQKIATLLSIQLIYSNYQDSALKDTIKEFIYSESVEVSCFTSFVLGSLYFGVPDSEIISILIQNLVDKSFAHPENSFFNFTILGLALLFYKNKEYESTIDTLREINFPYFNHVSILIKCMANIGSGDTELMNEILADAFDDENIILNFEEDHNEIINNETEAEKVSSKTKNEDEELNQNLLKSISLIGVSLLCIGDELFTKGVIRIVTSSSMIDNPHLKSTIPLCIALLSPSNPSVELIDFLNKQCNTSEIKSIINSIMALGIIGAGTNNARISEILEQQYSYNSKYTKIITALNIAQGLLFMGKGTFSLNPYCFNRLYLREKNFIGLLACIFMFIESEKGPMLSKHIYLNTLFIQASSLRHVTTVDTNLEFLKSQLRIGNPVNNVGVVGRPKKITSIQTHTSPIIVQDSEMVEIGEESITAKTDYIEDVIVIG